MVDYMIKVAKNVSLWSRRANWLGTLDATVPLIQANFGQFSSSREEANKDMDFYSCQDDQELGLQPHV